MFQLQLAAQLRRRSDKILCTGDFWRQVLHIHTSEAATWCSQDRTEYTAKLKALLDEAQKHHQESDQGRHIYVRKGKQKSRGGNMLILPAPTIGNRISQA